MRYLLLTLGWFSLAIGLIGAFLPVLPTVPFLLLAVWAFAQSSPRISARIMRHPTFGPPIRAWRRRGVVSRKAKVWAVAAMACGVLWALWLGLPPLIIVLQASVCTGIGAWLVTRPES
ncbi:YbaN family protein [Paracoccus sp. (in: a-proteobacteria)]|uniref:YbaN family protein n=1 Tax=Paracoccus sp. TaxID=267 RepID=UPI00321F8D59